MLISFKVANFTSIRDTLTLTLHRNRRMRRQIGSSTWDERISAVAAIYGANASGKTTVFRAITYLMIAVKDSYRTWEPDAGTGRAPFALDDSCSGKPSEFEIEFRAEDGIEYQYGFAAGDDHFEREWLYAYKTANRTVLFERGFTEEVINFGNSFRGDRKQLKDAAKARPNALTLSVGGQTGNSALSSAYTWISRNVRNYSAQAYMYGHRHAIDRLEKDTEFARRLTSVLERADLGVDAIHIVDDDDQSTPDSISEPALGGEPRTVQKTPKEPVRMLSLSHRTLGDSIDFPVHWESDGTLALISFATVALEALEAGFVCIVDEIDSSLHPILVAELVRIFQDPRSNPRQAQLIFTTHDVTLLSTRFGDHELLGRDQIWIVEKSVDGATSIVGLNEYQTPRKEENKERGYLTGRYGGIPIVSVLDALVSAREHED